MDVCTKVKVIRKQDEIEIHSSSESENEQEHNIQYFFKCINNELSDTKIDLKKITKLNLSMCNLTEIPIAVKELHLKYLSLEHNNLTVAPSCLSGGLKDLEYLDLGFNSIENFDTEPDCLPNIKTIKLHSNKFNNLPEWFLMYRCPNIEEFSFSHNKATDHNFIEDRLTLGFSKLKRLDLQNCGLQDKDVSFLQYFQKLEYLNIGNDSSRHQNIYLDQLFVKPTWHELRVLLVDNISLVILPESIRYIPSLTKLSVTGNYLSWLPHEIKGLRNLDFLDLSNNDLCALPNCVTELQNLRVIAAKNNNIEVVPDFSLMPSLKTLDFYNNKLEDVTLDWNIIDSVDVEYNYLDTSKWTNFSEYETKKSNLRRTFPGFRYDGPKEQPYEKVTDLESDGESDCSYEKLYYQDERNEKPVEFDAAENWDSPSYSSLNAHAANSDIDSEDQNWQGFEVRKYKIDNPRRVCVSDDDWCFEDLVE